MWVVPVRFEGGKRTYRLLVKEGSGYTILPRYVLQDLAGYVTYLRDPKSVPVSFYTVETLGHINKLCIEFHGYPYTLNTVYVTEGPMYDGHVDGILGLDFLGNTSRDNAKEIIFTDDNGVKRTIPMDTWTPPPDYAFA